MPRIALIPGDGIGTEVLAEARRVLEVCAAASGTDYELVDWDLGADRYLRDGVTITDDEFRSLSEEHDAVLLGALGDPRVPGNEHAKDILLGMRFRLDLYVNFRPCTLLSPELCPLEDVDPDLSLEIFRENTEGEYTGMGGAFKTGTPDELAIEENIATRKGVERIIRAAFEHARGRGRERVTLVDKANAMRHVGGLWRRVFADVAAEFPGVETNAMYVDAMAMDLVRRPERYQVIVAPNLFGDMRSSSRSMAQRRTSRGKGRLIRWGPSAALDCSWSISGTRRARNGFTAPSRHRSRKALPPRTSVALSAPRRSAIGSSNGCVGEGLSRGRTCWTPPE
jgi:3-isopropylmalate dehydrogenase